MSQKWVRSKRWDDQHLTGALWPVKVVLRALSSIAFGVVMLVLVSLYGILASVPIGLIALAPTWVFYAVTLVVSIAIIAAVPVWAGLRVMRSRGAPPAARFAVGLIALIVLAGFAVLAWYFLAWPALRYNPADGSGVRFFGAFVDEYKSLQFRRLPIMEMSELEFYSWWPLRLVLILFVISMVVATLRRIEFSLPYLGVITVHSGIVTIALGSVYYAAAKQEGDMLLLAGQPMPDGTTAPGPPETGFYDNTDTALWVLEQTGPDAVSLAGQWEQRRLAGVPRYHDYNLNVLGLKHLPPIMSAALADDQGPLDLPVGRGRARSLPLEFRVVGYASYAQMTTQTVAADQVDRARVADAEPMAVRTIDAYLVLENPGAAGDTGDPTRPRKTWRLLPDSPARRIDTLGVEGRDLISVEYTRSGSGAASSGMSEQRWRDLSVSIPRGTEYALIVRHPSSGFESVYPVRTGSTVAVGDSGFRLEVVNISAEPPFPIVTPGYQGARSSVAVVRVQPPAGADGQLPPAFERWVYNRFPEIGQDLLDAPPTKPGEQPTMPRRKGMDPSIEIALVDASMIHVYFDEQVDSAGATPRVRALVRLPGGGATITPDVLAAGGIVEVTPGFTLRVGEPVDDALRVEFPVPVPAAQQDPKQIGAHQNAAIAVEVSTRIGTEGRPWSAVVWLPFTQYLSIDDQNARSIGLPDGRRLKLAFGRVRHEFWPPMALRLADFEMIPYDHDPTLPRDYKSDVVVMRRWSDRHEDVIRTTSLNEPLLERMPFQPRSEVPAIVNWIGRAFSVLAPNQYKFSQAGWDSSGWNQSLAEVQRGERSSPAARFTILGVGNNPGIYIIAAGAVMMSIGIPWAFYVKPWMMRRRKKRIQEELAAGIWKSPGSTPAPSGASGGNGLTPHPSETGVPALSEQSQEQAKP